MLKHVSIGEVLEAMRRNWQAIASALICLVNRFISDMETDAMIARIIPRYIRQGGWREVVRGGKLVSRYAG